MKVDVIYTEDCRKGIPKRLPDESIDLMPTDPPYGIGFMGKEWDKFNQIVNPQGAYEKKKGFRKLPRQSSTFIREFFTPIWKECFRILKPGAFAFVMCIPRQDCLARQIISLEDAGFNVSFSPIFHAFAQGFPKSQNISKAIDKRLGAERKIIGKNPDHRKIGSKELYRKGATVPEYITKSATPQAQALDGSYSYNPKPAVEVVLVCQKPMKYKTYVDQALDWYQQNEEVKQGKRERTNIASGCVNFDEARIPYKSTDRPSGGFGGMDPGIGKPGEHQQHRGCCESNAQGRFPPNLLVSDDVLNTGKNFNQGGSVSNAGPRKNRVYGEDKNLRPDFQAYGDSGSFSRYFSLDTWFEKKFKELPLGMQKTFPFLITPKPSKAEKNRGCEGLEKEIGHNRFDRCKKCGGYILQNPNRPSACKCEKPEREHNKVKGNFHPTCKPLKLMSYLITLGSRPGDVILDPFLGSGTTAIAALMLGRHYIGYEIDKNYVRIAKARLSAVQLQLL